MMPVYDFAYEGQSHAGALFIVVFFIEPLEDAKYVFIKFFIDADAIIPDVKDLFFDAAFRSHLVDAADLDGFLFVVVIFHSVGNQVTEYFGHTGFVTDNFRQGARNDDSCVSLSQRRFHHRFDITDCRIEVGGPNRQFLAAKTREVQKVIDELFHALTEIAQAMQTFNALCIQLVLVILVQKSGIVEQAAQRFLQVMRGDIGEIVELLIAAFQLPRVVQQVCFGLFLHADVAHDF